MLIPLSLGELKIDVIFFSLLQLSDLRFELAIMLTVG